MKENLFLKWSCSSICFLALLLMVLLLLGIIKTERTLVIPAHSISYDHITNTMTPDLKGMNIAKVNEAASFTVAKPTDYAGGPVNLRFFFEIASIEDGTVILTAAPVGFNHGSSFETYGGAAAGPVANAPGSTRMLYEQSVDFTDEEGLVWTPNGDWWFFRIGRQGTFPGKVRLMSVAIDYKAKFKL